MTRLEPQGNARAPKWFGFPELNPYMVHTVSFQWEGNLLFPILSPILRKMLVFQEVPMPLLGCDYDLQCFFME